MNIKHPKLPRKEEMLARRLRQRSRRAGFTPVVNQRIEAQIKSMTALLTAGYAAQPEMAMPNSEDIRAEATRAVAQTLPATPIGVRTRRYA